MHSAMRFGLPHSPSIDDGQVREDELFLEACTGVIDGRYEVLRELGRGGMGVVLLVRDLQFNCLRAIKRPKQNSARVREGFNNEGIAAAAFNHPNICQVHHSGEDAYGPFLVMEFVDGENLKTLVSDGSPYPASTALSLTRGILLGLKCLHDHTPRILHRDIKPANVLMAKDGTPKLTDFGLAKIGETRGLSITGRPLGTEAYAAPEQWSDSTQASVRSDIYSFGRTLFYALTGGYPGFVTGTEVPGLFVEFLGRCMAEDPKDRFRDIDAALTALALLEEHPEAPATLSSTGMELGDCTECGASNDAERRFCWECSHPLVEECAHCHSINRTYMRYCGNCQVDTKSWKEMLKLLDSASAHGRLGDYETAQACLESAKNNSSGHEDFEPLGEEVSKGIEQLKASRGRIDSLCEESHFERALDEVRELLELAPEDTDAAKLLLDLPAKVQERDMDRVLGDIDSALDQQDLQAVSYLIERATLLDGPIEDPRLKTLRERRLALRRDRQRQSLEKLESSIKAREWPDTRRALSSLQEAEASAGLLFEQRHRLQIVRAIDDVELERGQELVNEITDRPASTHHFGRAWLAPLQAALHGAQQADVDQVEGQLVGCKKLPTLARISRDLEDMRLNFGSEFEGQITEMLGRCKKKRQGIILRRWGIGICASGLLAGLAAAAHVHKVSAHAELNYLNNWIVWFDQKEQGVPLAELGPAPELELSGLTDLFPQFVLDALQGPAFASQSPRFTEEEWQTLSWDQAKIYWDRISSRNHQQLAQNAFKSWEHRRLLAAIPEGPVVINLARPVLQLGGEFQAHSLLVDSNDVLGDTREGHYGFEVKHKSDPQERSHSIGLEGVSGTIARKNVRVLVDLLEPVGELRETTAISYTADDMHLHLRFRANDPREQVLELRYRTREDSRDKWSEPTTVALESDSTLQRLSFPIPQMFRRTQVFWEAVDRAGNVFELPAPTELLSHAENTARRLAKKTDLQSLAQLAELLLHGDGVMAHGDETEELTTIRSTLPGKLHAVRPTLKLRAGFLRESGELSDAALASFKRSGPTGPTRIRSGAEYLLPNRPLILHAELTGAVIDELQVQRLVQGKWEVLLSAKPPEYGNIELPEQLLEDDSPLNLRIGTTYLPEDLWTEFSVQKDSHVPEVTGAVLTRVDVAPPEILSFDREQLLAPGGLALPPGRYELDFRIAKDEPLGFLAWEGDHAQVAPADFKQNIPSVRLNCQLESDPGVLESVSLMFADKAGNENSWTQVFTVRDSTPRLLHAQLTGKPRGSQGALKIQYLAPPVQAGKQASGNDTKQTLQAHKRVPAQLHIYSRPTHSGDQQFRAGDSVKLELTFGSTPAEVLLELEGEQLSPESIEGQTATFSFELPKVQTGFVLLQFRIQDQNPLGRKGISDLLYDIVIPTYDAPQPADNR